MSKPWILLSHNDTNLEVEDSGTDFCMGTTEVGCGAFITFLSQMTLDDLKEIRDNLDLIIETNQA